MNETYPGNDLHAINYSTVFNIEYPVVLMTISNFQQENYVTSIILQPTKTSFTPQTNANTYRTLYWFAIGY